MSNTIRGRAYTASCIVAPNVTEPRKKYVVQCVHALDVTTAHALSETRVLQICSFTSHGHSYDLTVPIEWSLDICRKPLTIYYEKRVS